MAEYTGHAVGSFEVTNTSLAPAVVMLEPKSFSIDLDGKGEFRPLDAAIHLDLSTASLRLEPHQSARVFYKVDAENAPAWLCIYASFMSAKKSVGVNVRIMLPHTIYIYQKQNLDREAIHIESVRYDPVAHKVLCSLTNRSEMAGRASLVEVTGEHAEESQGGFPMLPHQRRLITVDWPSSHKPRQLGIDFEHFSLKLPVELPLD
ncbi:MAG: hypothetical protein ACRYGF_15135 [Janthinobacterium lividum]